MKRKICFIFELLLKIATIIFAFWGVCLQARDDGGFIRSNTYLYFTIISNLETVIIFSVFVVLRIAENIKGKQIIPKPLFMLKFMITAAMTLLISIKGVTYSNGTNFLYYFLNYREYGWFNLHGMPGVAWWILIVAVMAFAVTYLLLVFKRAVMKIQGIKD